VALPLRLLLVWICNVVALWVACALLSGLDYERFWHLLVAGAVFGIVNTILKPILTILGLPFIILTLGIAYFLINLLMLYITSWVVPGFEVNGFWQAVLGTIVIWFVNVVLRSIFAIDDRGRRRAEARAA
jgi:putative membrane protein